jgi:2-(1,2-epoxy-1,2-dihydrophenyl)acetyl-CoA isomerase
VVLHYSTEDGVAVILLNRPDVLNAFDDELGEAALHAVEDAAGNEKVRCVVITGAGRAFSAGEDLGALAGTYERGDAPELGRILNDRYNPLIRAIRGAPKPVVAAVNGVAAGAGASIALACDFRVASENARLVLAFVKVGLVPDSGSMWFLTKMVGMANAFELCALGEPISAGDGQRLGLFNIVAPPEKFEDAWREFAERLAAGPTRAYALTKSLANYATERSIDEQLEFEIEAQSEAGRSADHVEGVQAFLAKRPPRFRGR